MSSTTSSLNGFLSSPRMQRRVMWISGAVLAIGIAVFLGVFLSRGTSQPAENVSTVSSGGPSSTTPAQKNSPKVAPSPAAYKVARTFMETAVARKNLAASYGLVGPDLKGGMSLAQWKKGNIAVVPYPASDAQTTPFTVISSHKSHLELHLTLHPQKGSGVKALAFFLNLDRVGGKWIVSYWAPDYHVPIKPTPGN
jgi:hypothetical protein